MRFLKGKIGFDNFNKDDGLYLDILGCNWAVLSCNGVY